MERFLTPASVVHVDIPEVVSVVCNECLHRDPLYKSNTSV